MIFGFPRNGRGINDFVIAQEFGGGGGEIFSELTVWHIHIAANFTGEATQQTLDNMFKGIYHGKQCHIADVSAVLSRAWNAGVERIIDQSPQSRISQIREGSGQSQADPPDPSPRGRAQAGGRANLVTGGSLEESKEALAIAETDGRLFCTVGVHPTRCKEFEDSGDPEKHFQDLISLARKGVEKGKVVAIGECGLDYDRLQFCSAEIQKKYFEKQFELARAMKLPMFLHMRAAAVDFCDILARHEDKFSFGVAHSFTGSAEDRDKLLSFSNLYIGEPDHLLGLGSGVNGCSLKSSENLEVVREIPVERIMIETDSPYCEIKNTHAGISLVKSAWPAKKKEKHDPNCIVKGRNEPCLIRQVLEVLAGCKGVDDINQLSKIIYHNTCRVFFPQDLDSMADAYFDSLDTQKK
ncbi:hypothetical protein Scep_014668 [Stephania cephalantha]|uniref:Uncharacterized protein n=1 Tax=Stephania cephalantha TaxID=152367 RepID=A0AAP0J3S2_9MAGN